MGIRKKEVILYELASADKNFLYKLYIIKKTITPKKPTKKYKKELKTLKIFLFLLIYYNFTTFR